MKLTLPTLRYSRGGRSSFDAGVQRMQALLLVAGFYRGANLDGLFGSKTLVALNKFQRENALPVDGVCGPRTWSRLLGG